VIKVFLICKRSVKLNEGRQRKVKSANKTNESQSGAGPKYGAKFGVK
jgi:hypothetical protein